MGKLKVTLVRGLIKKSERQKRTVKALGLRKTNHTVVHDDNLAIRGMLKKVSHLVNVEEINE